MELPQPILSILMPTIPERKEKFDLLHKELLRQYIEIQQNSPELGSVEIVVDNSKRFLLGGITIGKKRDNLLRASKGYYICYLDDDDRIESDYLRTLLELCGTNYPVCTFNSRFICDMYSCIINMSIHHQNEEAGPNKIVKRAAWHICPMKREFAIQYYFPNTNNAEDWEFMKQVMHHFVEEAHTNKVIHNYVHSSTNSEADRIEFKKEARKK